MRATMRATLSLCLLALGLAGAAACQRGASDAPPPNARRKPAGEDWWCAMNPEVRMSCQRTQEQCETDRGRMKNARPELPLEPCRQLPRASCLTWRPRGSGNEAPFCLPTAELCQETRRQLLADAADKGHTLITGCATWE
jgi:hypothetical protein